MNQSPKKETQTTVPRSAAALLLITALDTSWRAFVPTIGGCFLGIGLDHLFNIAPVATIICLIVGTVLSALLIIKQLRDARKPL